MEAVRKSNVKYTWELISQFVCWEFCRNTDFEGDISDAQNQADLFQFFRDMVIKMTTKQNERDITPHEIAAKFIEELSVLANSSNPRERASYVIKLSESLKRFCPKLKPAITDLLSALYLKLLSLEESNCNTLMEDDELRNSIQVFCAQVCKHLPVPELIKATNSWKEPDGVPVKPLITKELITSRLKKEKLSRQEIVKIKGYIEEDTLLKMYFDEVSYTGPGLEDFPADALESNKERVSTDRSSQRKTASKSSNTSKKSLDDYFMSAIQEVTETPVKSRGSKHQLIDDSDSDDFEIIAENLSEPLRDARVAVDRFGSRKDKGTAAASFEMPVPPDQIKKEAFSPKKGDNSGKSKKKKKNMFF